jgi:heat shock transcription factor
VPADRQVGARAARFPLGVDTYVSPANLDDIDQFEQNLMVCYPCIAMQGFRKVDPDKWEFTAEGFLREQKELLKMIRRRRQQSNTPPAQQQQQQGAGLEVGTFGHESEVHHLQYDKSILIAELLKLWQEQHATRALMQAMEARIAATKLKQQQMAVLLARAMKSPSFL